MTLIPEPDFQNEKELENAVAATIRAMLGSEGTRGIVLPGFGLDIAVFIEKDGISRVRLFEIKAFADHHGRCGFGSQRGEGNQIRMLYDEAAGAPRERSRLSVFDATVRWVLGNRSAPLGSDRFVIFNCQQAEDAAMNGVRPGKQNNLRLTAFAGQWITWPALIERIEAFLRSA